MDKSKAILVLLAANLLAVVYVGYSLHGAVRNGHAEQDAEIRNLQQQVQQLESAILNGVRQELTARDEKVEALDYTWSAVDIAQKSAQIGLEVELQEVSASAEIVLTLAHEEMTAPMEAVLEPLGGMRYGAELELSVAHNYELRVWERNADGQRQMNAASLQLPLYDELYARRVQEASTGTSISGERLTADVAFQLQEPAIPGTELEKVLLRITRDGAVYDEVDLTAQATSQSARSAGLEQQYNLALAAGEIDPSVTLEQFISDREAASDTDTPAYDGRARYTVSYTLDYAKDAPELGLDAESATELGFEWVLTFADGYVWPED
ncbi:hypothetical protein IDH44_15835 [Paenibacillus sp. IB182496]|uniref:Uncharacterized protein n=1 Tax=Paenibacillus sabuli TaxID=2772509 RepID=A0A927BW06_9BACL|nr:hypothetical protein [Paenibacillus sabuli]MBD2846670.1 hypothetical protein [Paenibacillus sabuli]